MPIALPRREREILDLLFQAGECTARDVHERLSKPPTYSAVRALLAKLVDKGLVSFRVDGNRYVYSPTEDQERAGRSALRHLVSTFFEGSPARAANALLGMESEALSQDERDRLLELIARLDADQEETR